MENKKRKSGKKVKRKKKSAPSGGGAAAKPAESASNLMFEDPFEDEFVQEEIINPEDAEGGEGGDSMMEDTPGAAPQTRVWMPGRDKLEEGQELDFDSRAYSCLHRMSTEWPCLSFDFLRDKLGSNRTRFPATMFLVAGTQADDAAQNQIALMKVTDLHRMKHDDDEDNSDDDMSDSDDDDLDDDPILECRTIKHNGCINRIRAMPQQPNIVSTWADTSNVHVWDLSKQLTSLEGGAAAAAGAPTSSSQSAMQTFTGHTTEGFAMDWSPVTAGRMITGDCSNHMYLWQPQEGGTWAVNPSPFLGHTSSVEDVQWSPTEDTVFMSCSADKTVKVWDTRSQAKAMMSVEAHTEDVNVISWNRKVAYLLASASDDGSFKVWDLRNFQGEPVANFQWHRGPCTSIEWNPHDESVLAVTGADHQLTVWDLSLEEDTADGANAAAAKAAGIEDLPPQLLFVHQGQQDMKELHFHDQIPGMLGSTGRDFNLFKPANIDNLQQPDEGT